MVDRTDGDELHLNTLARFRKQPGLLHLEEYSHCEIPAGCGGVVLRWIDLKAGVPHLIWTHGWCEALSVWIDGEPVTVARMMLKAGAHVLSLHLQRSTLPEP